MQVSAEDTFENDLLLGELEPHIRRLAEKTWAGHQRERGRVARTVVLKLKTADFQTLTRSLTPATPSHLGAGTGRYRLRAARSGRAPGGQRYRLVGVGLSGFVDEDDYAAQSDLFGARAHARQAARPSRTLMLAIK